MPKLLPSALFVASVVFAVDPPTLKEGLWSIHTQTTENPGNKVTEGTKTLCRSHAYDDHARQIAKEAAAKCKTSDQVSGSKVISESECTVGATVLHTKGTVTLTGDTASHGETHTTYNPAFYGSTESTMIMDQKYLGPCPANLQPGDMVSQDGRVTHL
jgi:hypothetical protein